LQQPKHGWQFQGIRYRMTLPAYRRYMPLTAREGIILRPGEGRVIPGPEGVTLNATGKETDGFGPPDAR
jgi:hypothetical protein